MPPHKNVTPDVKCLSVRVPLGNRSSFRWIKPEEVNKGGTGLRETNRVWCSVPRVSNSRVLQA